MSSVTGRCILPSRDDAVSPHFVLFSAGLAAAAAQCAYVRESLTIFSGNELVIGIVLAVWLASSGAGSLLGGAWRVLDVAPTLLAAAVSSVAGVVALRASRLFFEPGVAIPPLAVFLLALAQTPAALLYGMSFGHLARRQPDVAGLYAADSAGNAAGLLVVWVCILAGVPTAITLALATVILLGAVRRIRAGPAMVMLACAALIGLDKTTLKWKYGPAVFSVSAGREGEIARIIRGADTTLMLNGAVLRSTIGSGMREQSVHVPLALCPAASRVLVVHDRGHRFELQRYEGLTIDVLESDPAFAVAGSIIAAPETYRPSIRYDAVLLGADIPSNAAEGRLLTAGFFQRMKRMMRSGGVLSFTLSLSDNYLNPAERKLLDVERATLGGVFRYVRVFPGEGYTFLASDRDIGGPIVPRVPTDFLGPQILPTIDSFRVAQANGPLQASPPINTAGHPVVLLLGLQRWMTLMGEGWWALGAVLAAALAAGAALLPRRISTLSIGTSGCAAGIYSVAVMLLYQSTYGALYSRVALLLVSFSAGCVLGSRVRHLPFSDATIGVYATGSLLLLAALPEPPAALFYACNGAMGLLVAAQYVALARGDAGALYAADLLGGVAGMALCSTALAPLFGIPAIALGVGAGKLLVALTCRILATAFPLSQRGPALCA